MKTPHFILMIALCALFCQQAQAGDPVWMTGASAQQKQASILVNPAFHSSSAPDPCSEYKRRQIAGFVIFPVGAGLMVGGGYMVYKGVTDINNQISNTNFPDQQFKVSRRDIVFISAGTGMALIGLVLIPTGIAMGTIATVRYRKFCGTGSRALYITPSQNGVGLACNF